jgi:PTS system nitrogen regulatory IIA component
VKLPGVKKITCLFARLERAIPFESHDGEPVDLLFFLLAPEEAGGDHLKALARISRLVRDPATLEDLRSAQDVEGLRRVLTQPLASHAA